MLQPTAPAPMMTMSAARGVMVSPPYPANRVQSGQPPLQKGSAMREAVVVESLRTPLAKSFRGSFNLTRPDDLAAHVINELTKKVPQLSPEEITDVILGCGQPHGVQGTNIARVATIRACLSASIAAITVNR